MKFLTFKHTYPLGQLNQHISTPLTNNFRICLQNGIPQNLFEKKDTLWASLLSKASRDTWERLLSCVTLNIVMQCLRSTSGPRYFMLKSVTRNLRSTPRPQKKSEVSFFSNEFRGIPLFVKSVDMGPLNLTPVEHVITHKILYKKWFTTRDIKIKRSIYLTYMIYN